MIPGEIITLAGDIELNVGAPTVTLEVANTGDRPIQVGSHYHFFETNNGLVFDRAKARGMRLDIAAGTAVRFEPGQSRTVRLTPYLGGRESHGFQARVSGAQLRAQGTGLSLSSTSTMALATMARVITGTSPSRSAMGMNRLGGTSPSVSPFAVTSRLIRPDGHP